MGDVSQVTTIGFEGTLTPPRADAPYTVVCRVCGMQLSGGVGAVHLGEIVHECHAPRSSLIREFDVVWER